MIFQPAVDGGRVPRLRVAHVVNRDVVVLTPEKRHGIKSFAATEHVSRRGLPLTLRDHPVLHTNAIARMPIGPARDIAGSEHARRAGLEVLVHTHPAIDGQRSLLGKCEPRPYAYADDNEARLER